LKEVNPNAKITRLDYELTVQGDEEDPNVARRLYKALEKVDFRPKGGRQTSCQLVFSPKRGSTIYIGARSSAGFCRIYDKSLEQRGKIAPRLWRYEGEYKRTLATSGWEAFCESSDTVGLARDVVVATMQSKGVDMDFVENAEPRRLPSRYEPTDDARRLEWLASHVSKTAQRLCATQGRHAVANALGISLSDVSENQGDSRASTVAL
jgi:DNA relaxase NicK